MFTIKAESGILNYDMIESIYIEGDTGHGYALVAVTSTYYTGGNSHRNNKYTLTRRMDKNKATKALNQVFAALVEGAPGFDFTI